MQTAEIFECVCALRMRARALGIGAELTGVGVGSHELIARSNPLGAQVAPHGFHGQWTCYRRRAGRRTARPTRVVRGGVAGGGESARLAARKLNPGGNG